MSDPPDADLLERAYRELRELAGACLRRERQSHTLQPTALVHEAWLRLGGGVHWGSKTQFLALSARAMRRILVDHARARARLKRGGARLQITLTDALQPDAVEDVDILGVNDALATLDRRSERQARIVELRFFAGMTVDEVAIAMGLSPRTVAAEWSFARAWLSRELGRRE